MITYSTVAADPEHNSYIELVKDTTNLVLTDELLSIDCENFGKI